MAGGAFNNTATVFACAEYRKKFGLDGLNTKALTPVVDASNVTWCTNGYDVHVGYDVHLNNCHMREHCTAAGATGDSWCKDKYWV
ncbi:hypothetical protein LY78DRAFT_660664 [Colletotrichum sublineola]|nr:hypothetical protein LY78DRAFT_660664 [Colletotrichum sublineola]